MSLSDTLLILLGFTAIFLLVGTAVIYTIILHWLPFGKIYLKLKSHYNEKCPIFTTPPPTYETYDEINKEYGTGRINAIISEYFLFAIMAVFILFTIIGYFLSNVFGLWLEGTIGITINPVVSKELFNLIMKIEPLLIGIGFFIIAPQLIMNPYLNYLLMQVLFNRQTTPPLHDGAKANCLTNYLSLDTVWRNLVYGAPCMMFFYFSAKIITVIVFGVTFVSEYNVYVTSACLAFSITFLLACRSIALSEMFPTT